MASRVSEMSVISLDSNFEDEFSDHGSKAFSANHDENSNNEEEEETGFEEEDGEGGGGEEISEPDSMFYRQMLVEYAQDGNEDGVREMLFKAKSIPNFCNTVDSTTFSVLHHTCFRSLIEVSKILIEAGANMYAIDKFGKTPLHLTIQNGCDELSLYLLERTHPLDYPKKAKLTLMQMSASQGRSPVIKALSRKGVNINERNNLGETPLHLSTLNNKLEAMETLIRLGADYNAIIKDVGHTPMHYACMYGYTEATVLLLKAGADAHIPNTTVLGRTPLETAKDSGFRPLFNLLLDMEMNMRQEREDGAFQEELKESKKHEVLLEKMELLQKTNAAMNKELKTRRQDQKDLESDHELRMAREKRNAIKRKESMKRVSVSNRNKSKDEVDIRKLLQQKMKNNILGLGSLEESAD